MDKFTMEITNELEIWENHAIVEDSPLGGNVVKAALYRGTATGLKIALNIYHETKEQQCQS